MIPIDRDVGVQTVVGTATRTVVVADETAFVRDRFRSALASAGHRVRCWLHDSDAAKEQAAAS